MSEKKLATIALQLVRFHYEKDDTRFDESCIELEKWLYGRDEIDLAESRWRAAAPRARSCRWRLTMTNGTASETNGILSEATLLPCPFCGGEASWIAARQREDGTYHPASCGCRKCGIQCYGERDYGHGGFATEEDREVSMEQAVSKWNTRACEEIAAALGGGKLTAEQVRECTEIVYLEGYSDGSVNRGAHIEETDWQAIADELNVMLGSGECEDVSTKNGIFKCSECGCTVEEDGVDWGYIQFCPDCGRAVKR